MGESPRSGVATSAHPTRSGLRNLRQQIEATEAAAQRLTRGLSAEQFNWRPAPGRWSVGEHLAHLNLVDRSYLPHLDALLAAGRLVVGARRPRRPPRLGRVLVRSAEPPVRLKIRTTRSYVPPSTLDRDAVLREFAATRRALAERAAAAEGMDVHGPRRRFAPGIGPAKFVTLSLGQWLALTAVHDRRHLWLAERAQRDAAFPTA